MSEDGQQCREPKAQRPAAPLALVRGNATPEEIAALMAVLSAVGRDEEPEPEAATSAWASPAGRMRHLPAPGVDAWRASGFPG